MWITEKSSSTMDWQSLITQDDKNRWVLLLATQLKLSLERCLDVDAHDDCSQLTEGTQHDAVRSNCYHITRRWSLEKKISASNASIRNCKALSNSNFLIKCLDLQVENWKVVTDHHASNKEKIMKDLHNYGWWTSCWASWCHYPH